MKEKKQYSYVLFDPDNPKEYVKGEYGGIMVFDSLQEGRKFLESRGATAKQLDRLHYLRSVGKCVKCGKPLFRSLIPGYRYQCFWCDEDFYAIEQGGCKDGENDRCDGKGTGDASV